MLTAISRYGARFVPELDDVVEAHRRKGTLVRGGEIAAFEECASPSGWGADGPSPPPTDAWPPTTS